MAKPLDSTHFRALVSRPTRSCVGRLPAALERTTAVVACCLLTACGFAHVNQDNSTRPERAIGSAARVLMPGEAPPDMSQPVVTEEPVLLGGGEIEGDTSERTRDVPLGPLAVLFGYPFWIFGKSVTEEAEEAARERELERQNDGAAAATAAADRDRLQRERLARENERMLEQLGRQQPATGTVAPRPTPGPSTAEPRAAATATPSGSLALRQELAALERALERRQTAEASSQDGSRPPVAPATPVPPGTDPMRRSATTAPEAATGGFSQQRSADADRETTQDRDADGRPDRWVYGSVDAPERELLDENRDGRADVVRIYDAERRLMRTEEDLDFDGRYEVVTQYRDGRRARRSEDSNGDGQIDLWSYYQAGELVRLESDKDGDGFRDVIASYAAGQLTQQEEDRNGDGQPDRLERFRAGETIEIHEDMDFDGKLDVASFYEKGKLVRRELRSEEVLRRWNEASDSGSRPDGTSVDSEPRASDPQDQSGK